MAILNKTNYQNLNSYGMNNQQRERTFYKVFITGEPRASQEVGKLQAASYLDYDKPENSKYIINNIDNMKFIPMFLKKIRAEYKYDGNNEKLVSFSWDPDNDPNVSENAKCEYIIAGVALTDDLKPIKFKDPNKPDEKEKTALLYFRCNGVKCGSAIEFLNAVTESSKGLDPLSDDPEFEVSVVSWRRHIVNVTVTTAKTNFGNKYVYKFTLGDKLPDDNVKKFLDQSKSIVEKFEKQFNLSNASKQQSTQGTAEQEQIQQEEKEVVINEQDVSKAKDLSSIDLGL